MIDVRRENLQLLSQAAQIVPGRPHISTLIRWALRGVKGVQLETVLVGGRRFTSVEAVNRFIARLSGPESASEAPGGSPRKSIDEVRQELDGAGIDG